jgi:hypothetical protein
VKKGNETAQKGTLCERLSPRQETVAALLAAGWTHARAARECRLGNTTLYRWLKVPVFRDRIAELRSDLVDRAIGRLADLMGDRAADTLEALLGAKSDSVKLDSVKAVFELFLQCTNAAELKARIEALETNQPRGRR